MDHSTGTTQEPEFSSKTDDNVDEIVDDYTVGIFVLVIHCLINSIICVFGIITNIINVAVFVKQGFQESINISLLGLAISDMSSLITLLWGNICLSPIMDASNVPFITLDVAVLTSGWPRKEFTRIIAWITAFITFEKCVCIVVPLKVKMIFTPKRTLIIIISIFGIVFGSMAPMYYANRLAWKFVPERNRSLIGLVSTTDRQTIERVIFVVSNVFLPVVSFVLVVLFTGILALKLKSKSKWRGKSVVSSEDISAKDKNIIFMVASISSIFIICSMPDVFMFLVMSLVPEFGLGGKYIQILLLVSGVGYFMESLNSSVNIFLYLKMSSKYRDSFKRLFGHGK